MEERTDPHLPPAGTPERAPIARVRSQRFRAGAVLVLALVLGLILWLALRSDNSSTPTNATAVTEVGLSNLAASVKHPIFWVGPRPGFTYELRHLQDGSIHVRYLPSGVDVGNANPYLTVATYPFRNPYQALKNLKSKDIVFVKIPKGGIAEYTKKNPADVHAAYPGVDYQVEVYDPTPGTAMGLLVSGQLTALGDLRAGSAGPAPKPTAATFAELKAVAKDLGHPIYWAGPKKGYTYELLRTSDGQVHIRYLPKGVEVGSATPYLTVGTYPFPNAFKATNGLTSQKNTAQVQMPGGGVAVLSKSYPQSIHLAFPSSDLQIEVYDPSAAKARALVSSGQVQAIG
jgi:hypothetical protein